jgi:hypothetical protein
VKALVGEAIAQGFTHVKMKVGRDLDEDVQHLSAFDFVAVSGTMEDRVVEGSTTCTSTSATRPSSRTGAIARRSIPATASRCCPSPWTTSSTRAAAPGRPRP